MNHQKRITAILRREPVPSLTMTMRFLNRLADAIFEEEAEYTGAFGQRRKLNDREAKQEIAYLRRARNCVRYIKTQSTVEADDEDGRDSYL